MENKHLIDPMDFSIEELDEIFCLAQDIMKSPEKYSKICDGKHFFMNQVQEQDLVLKLQ